MSSSRHAQPSPWIRGATAAVAGLAFAVAHYVQLRRGYPGLGRGALTLGIALGHVYGLLVWKADRLVGWWQRWRRETPDGGSARRGEAIALLLRLYPLLLLVPEFYDATRLTHNEQTRNFMVLEGLPQLYLCHLAALVTLGALLVARLRMDRLRVAVSALVAVNFVAYFFRNQGEYRTVHVVRQVLEWDTVPGPWRHRVLVPWTFEALGGVGLTTEDTVFATLFILAVPMVFFTVLVLGDLLDRYGPGGFWLAVLAPLLLVFGFDVVYVTTLPELLFAALFLRYAVDRRFLPSLVVLALGCLNRETFAFFGVSYLVIAWEGQAFRIDGRLLREVVGFAAVAGGLRLATWIGLGRHRVAEFHHKENLAHLKHYLQVVLGSKEHEQSPYRHTNFVYAVNKPLIVFGSLHLVALLLGRRARPFWLATLVVTAIYVGLILPFGMLNESRMLFVTLPLVLLTLHAARQGDDPVAGDAFATSHDAVADDDPVAGDDAAAAEPKPPNGE